MKQSNQPDLKPKPHRAYRKDSSTHFDNLFENHVNFAERVVYLNDEISELSLDLFLKAFDELEKVDKPDEKTIRVEISSYGGSVYDMLGIVDRIKASPCTVITRGFGKIFSAATFILAAGDERYIGTNSWIMLHQISDMLKGSLGDLKNELEHTEALERQMLKMLEKFSTTKKKRATFERLSEKNCYLSAQEVLKLGLVDNLI